MAQSASNAPPEGTKPAATKDEKSVRKISGNLVYLSNYGAVKKVLDKISDASKPDKFTQDFLATVLNLSGGGYKAAIPVLKRVGLVAPDGTPTEMYTKFRTESGRADAAYSALKTGFAELFRRNEHVYAANDQKLIDLIVEATGLPKNDSLIGPIKGTFRVFSSYLPPGFTAADVGTKQVGRVDAQSLHEEDAGTPTPRRSAGAAEDIPAIGLSYNINIVLPETKDIEVFNSIFRSIRDNLLKP